MPEIGDKIILLYDDDEDNTPILGKVVEVIEIITKSPPYWVRVLYDGRDFTIRAGDTKRA